MMSPDMKEAVSQKRQKKLNELLVLACYHGKAGDLQVKIIVMRRYSMIAEPP